MLFETNTSDILWQRVTASQEMQMLPLSFSSKFPLVIVKLPTFLSESHILFKMSHSFDLLWFLRWHCCHRNDKIIAPKNKFPYWLMQRKHLNDNYCACMFIATISALRSDSRRLPTLPIFLLTSFLNKCFSAFPSSIPHFRPNLIETADINIFLRL